mmetsp:Transcript_40073/g.82440  ORF Transcript_40073/g.82440 Transcript_40073/m.82440 type:complete len:193 (+) Transcript_40073:258-836(+)
MLPTIVDRPSKTCYSTLYFPNGVAVEKFNRYGEARRKLKEKCPIYVDKLLAAEGLMEEYDALIDDFIRTEGGCCMQKWDTKKIQDIVTAHQHKFEAKGVAVFISHQAGVHIARVSLRPLRVFPLGRVCRSGGAAKLLSPAGCCFEEGEMCCHVVGSLCAMDGERFYVRRTRRPIVCPVLLLIVMVIVLLSGK